VQDLVVTDILPQMVALSETYFQVYELKGSGGGQRGGGSSTAAAAAAGGSQPSGKGGSGKAET
jgi:hypothetical protein